MRSLPPTMKPDASQGRQQAFEAFETPYLNTHQETP